MNEGSVDSLLFNLYVLVKQGDFQTIDSKIETLFSEDQPFEKLRSFTKKYVEFKKTALEAKMDENTFNQHLNKLMENVNSFKKEVSQSTIQYELLRIQLQICLCYFYIFKGKSQDGLKASRELVEKINTLNEYNLTGTQDIFIKTLRGESLCLQAMNLFGISEFDESEKVTGWAHEIFYEINDIHGISTCMNILGNIAWRRGRIDEALRKYKKVLKDRQKLGHKKEIAAIHNNIGLANWNLGNLETSLHHHHKSLELKKEVGTLQDISISYHNIGLVYKHKGDFKEALKYFLEAVEIDRKIGNPQEIGVTLTNIANVYKNLGELSHAILIHREANELFEEIKNDSLLAASHQNLANLNRDLGEIEEAYSFCNESLKIKEKIGNNFETSITLINLGTIFYEMGDIEKAFQSQKRSYELLIPYENSYHLSTCLFNLISYLSEFDTNTDEIEMIPIYMEHLRKLSTHESNKLTLIRYQLANALILKAKHRRAQKYESEVILRSLINDPDVEYPFNVLILENLCELIIEEFKASPSQEISDEATSILQRIENIGRKEYAYPVLIRSLLLQSKFKFVEGDFKEFERLNNYAKILTQQKKLVRLSNLVETEEEKFQKELIKWKSIIEENQNVYERLHENKIREYMDIVFS